MSNYIKIVMQPTVNHVGGSFTALASFKLDNINIPFHNIPVKIDTGCSVSVIPLAKFRIPQFMLNKMKYNDIKSGIDYLESYGVETGGIRHKSPETYKEKMECTALKFKHAVSDFEIDGVPISHEYMYVNYDRKSNILIGMDILKNWDIHIGTAGIGKTIFLACPKDQMNDDYLQELQNIFSITSQIDALILRQGNHS